MQRRAELRGRQSGSGDEKQHPHDGGGHVGGATLTDRVACCGATDGRTMAAYANSPCVPATSTFANGAVCESATHVVFIEASYVTAAPPLPSRQSARLAGHPSRRPPRRGRRRSLRPITAKATPAAATAAAWPHLVGNS